MNAALDALRTRFVERCTEDRVKLGAVVAARDADALKLLSHKLAGAAGTFGYPSVSQAALAVEDELDAGDWPAAERLQHLDQELAQITASK